MRVSDYAINYCSTKFANLPQLCIIIIIITTTTTTTTFQNTKIAYYQMRQYTWLPKINVINHPQENVTFEYLF
jgi:hypothetical protein